MTHGSLFSGIGGFDLASEWMGWDNVFHCEWDAFGQKVLKHYWPQAITYGDITETDFTIHCGHIDVLTGGSPASPSHQQENDLEKQMRDISGRRCLEQFGQFNRAGFWERTFMELLIGAGAWYSKRCRLTWKLKGTKYNRLYFQLVPSALPTEETGSGLLDVKELILTPTTIQIAESPEQMRKRAKKKGYKNKTKYSTLLSQILYDPKMKKFLPTPTESDNKNRGNPTDQCVLNRLQQKKQVGLTMMVDGQLNLRFVAEMMGFPTNWTELPFQN